MDLQLILQELLALLGIIGGDIMTGGQSINNLAAFAPLGGNTLSLHTMLLATNS